MKRDLPVIFLAFANEFEEGRHLVKLTEEYKQLSGLLEPVSLSATKEEDEAICELIVKTNVRIGEIIDVFQANPRIAIFHYGGHADGYQLLLEEAEGGNQAAYGEGLVSLLSRQANLKLIFLNGCSTQKLAQDLVARGVPAVIGTSASIADETALRLSHRFYQGLAGGLTLSGAWESAKDEIKTFVDPKQGYRGIYKPGLKDVPDRFPWDVEFRDEASKEIFSKWNLPEDARNPLFGLPPLPHQFELPPSPFLFLQPYQKQHAEIFFGRSYYIRDLYLKVSEPSAPPVILLYGESGAGKSSLLDAGLWPRLDAAVDPVTGKALFEVHYERRNADLGLVGTLAGMLSYTRDALPGSEASRAEDKPDPNLEKIRWIEDAARQLEGEAQESFLQFIDRYRSIHANRSNQEQRQQLFDPSRTGDYTGATLRQAWREIEDKTGRRLILILDQVEELFTRPHPRVQHELEGLIHVLKDIFGTPPQHPGDVIRGKVILGYREEFNAKIESKVRELGLPRSVVFLEQLKRKDVLDIFDGLDSKVVRQYYNLTVEEGLPILIADDLLKGKESPLPGEPPIAPVLQLILTKLWDQAYEVNSANPHFSIDNYEIIQRRGEQMEKFFEEQLLKIEAWDGEVVSSGLALDVLKYHISDLGTSSRRHIDDIRRRYRHLPQFYSERPGLIDELVEEMKKHFLLNDNGRGFTSLPHDTLAPIIQRDYHRSDKLGQRSARIIDTKAPEFVKARQVRHKNGKRHFFLDDNDLSVVEGGLRGMRALEEEEDELLRISREEREKRLRLQRILLQGGIVAGLFILLATIAAASLSVSMTRQVAKGTTARAHELSLVQKEEDPDLANRLASFAYTGSEAVRLDLVHNLYELFRQGRAAQGDSTSSLSLDLQHDAKIRTVDYYPGRGVLAGLENDRMVYWPGGSERNVVIHHGIPDGKPGFTADGNYVQVSSRSGASPCYLIGGKTRVSEPALDVYLNLGEYYGDDQNGELAKIGHYDFLWGVFVDEATGVAYTYDSLKNYLFPDADKPYGLYYKDGDWINPLDFQALSRHQLCDDSSYQFQPEAAQQALQSEWAFVLQAAGIDSALSQPGEPLSVRLLSLRRTTGNQVTVWGLSGPEPMARFEDPGPLDLLVPLSGDRLLVLPPAGPLQLRDAAGFPLRTFATGPDVDSIGIGPGQKRFFVQNSDSIQLWDFQSGELVFGYRHPGGRPVFSADGNRLLSFSPDSVFVLNAEGAPNLSVFRRGNEKNRIASARFHRDKDYLVIGLAPEGDSLITGRRRRFLGLFPGARRTEASQVIFWNIRSEKSEQVFAAPGMRLQDAVVSSDGHYAAAVDSSKVAFISARKNRGGSRLVRVIERNPVKAGSQPDVFMLSPAGRYVAWMQQEERRLDLFNLYGENVRSYSLENGFRQGFSPFSLFTPDDAFVIASKDRELLLWRPEPEAISDWMINNELSLEEKKFYNLDTFNDTLPGAGESKGWAVGAIIFCLLFILLFFSGYFIQFVQEKNYLELGLYGGVFLLLGGILFGLWSSYPDKKLFLYTLSWTAFMIASASIYHYRQSHKRHIPPVYALVAGVILAISGYFFFLERAYYPELLERYESKLENYNEIARQHQQALSVESALNTALAPGKGEGVTEESATADMEAELAYLGILKPSKPKPERFFLFAGLLLVGALVALVVYPLFHALRSKRQKRDDRFYQWLSAPVAFLSVVVWLAFISTSGDAEAYGRLTAYWLRALGWVILPFFILAYTLTLIRQKRRALLTAYAIPTLFALSLGFIDEPHVSFITIYAGTLCWLQSRQLQRTGNSQAGFLFASLGLFLLCGGILQSVLAENMVNLVYLAVLPVLTVLLLRRLRRRVEKIEDGRSVYASWMAIAGLWMLSFFVSFFYAGDVVGHGYFGKAEVEETVK